MLDTVLNDNLPLAHEAIYKAINGTNKKYHRNKENIF
jgi:hypothetical protein